MQCLYAWANIETPCCYSISLVNTHHGNNKLLFWRQIGMVNWHCNVLTDMKYLFLVRDELIEMGPWYTISCDSGNIYKLIQT